MARQLMFIAADGTKVYMEDGSTVLVKNRVSLDGKVWEVTRGPRVFGQERVVEDYHLTPGYTFRNVYANGQLKSSSTIITDWNGEEREISKTVYCGSTIIKL